jgi:hypothetical protein
LKLNARSASGFHFNRLPMLSIQFPRLWHQTTIWEIARLHRSHHALFTLKEVQIRYSIITEAIVPIEEEIEAQERFEAILRTIPKYGKNDMMLAGYLKYPREIQNLLHRQVHHPYAQ